MAEASEKNKYSAVLVFVQYVKIKANTVNVYFGLIFGYVSASRTKRENRAKLSELRGIQLNPPHKKRGSTA